ncbi:SGNH/GDSL hydrolase family protein [Pontiellaceae bacterium B12227]|nr:SGNH/GDSL hydrolase family protein [Pontiellaceae bacterium B12227]
MRQIKRMALAGFIFAAGTASFGVESVSRAEDAWYKLVGPRFAKRPEFAFVQNDPTLPNVLIYGDSISIHYTQRVRHQLKNKANVYRLYRNGSNSGSFIAGMSKMQAVMQDVQLDGSWDFNWDVIHFNVGLHDLKYLSGKKLDKENGKQVASLETYKKNLTEIVLYLKKLAPDAVLVFATTTPVPGGAAGRFAGDAQKYNQAALEVLKRYPEIVLNDLYAFTKPHHSDWWVKPGDVHYNDAGRQAQGEEVARIILNAFTNQK